MFSLIMVLGLAATASYESYPSETVDQFIVRNARSIEAIGIRENAEVCGAIILDGDRYRLTVSTKKSNIQCTVEHSEEDILIHTHLPYMGMRFSPADYSHPGYMIRNGVICYNSGERGTEVTITKYGRRNGGMCEAQ